MADEVVEYNRERWEELARANIEFSRPALNLNRRSARLMVDAEAVMGDVSGKDVLCLAGGGGQQSAAFGLLGAHVTVLELCRTQLERDHEAARHYGFHVATMEGDMRDLSCFGDNSFDIVWQAHSLNFVPDPIPVFDEVARVVRPAGLYRVECMNPFTQGLVEGDWDGHGYSLRLPYVDGAEIEYRDPYWAFDDAEGKQRRVKGPREFRHTLGTLVNGLVARGFVMLGAYEAAEGNSKAKPGTWDHFAAIAPPWLTFWTTYRPDLTPPKARRKARKPKRA